MAGRAATVARPAAQGAGGHRRGAGARGGAGSVIDVLDAFLADLAPIPTKRIDFLTALRDNSPPDITRLYWLARVTLVSRLDDVPYFDAVFAAHFAGAPP